MLSILIVFKREVKKIFFSPMFYIFLSIYLLFIGLIELQFAIFTQQVNMVFLHLSNVLGFVLAVVLPSGLFINEKKTGTLDLLLLSNLNTTSIVLGKFFAVYFVYILYNLFSIVFVLINWFFSTSGIDLGSVVSIYIAIILFGGAFLSINTFISSIPLSQVLAGIMSFSFSFLLLFAAPLMSNFLPLFERFNFLNLYGYISSGSLDTSRIAVFMFSIVFFLFLTIRSLEFYIWNKQ